MRSTNKTNCIVAVILLIGAAVAWQRSQHFMHLYRWVVLEQPIRFEDGFSTSHQFTVDVAGKYWVEVECQKTVPFHTLDDALNKRLAMECAVSSGTERIAFGDTSKDLGMSGMADSISRRITSFDAVPSVPYNLASRTTVALPEIASTHPT